MAGIPGTQLDEGTTALIRDYNLGGVILFARNIENPIQIAVLCSDLQRTALRHHGLPLFISVDQEGGRVSRLRNPFTEFPGNAAIGLDKYPLYMAEKFGRITALEMELVGLNMDLAPVVDVRAGEPERHLKGRIFGDNPEAVALLGRRVIRSLQESGIMAVAKHFPGLGRASIDPHFNLPKIEIAIKEMEKINLVPFKAAIDEGVSAVMTSHAIYPDLDPQLPATLSLEILTRLLREKLGFNGLIITDDMEMGAIAKHRGVAEGTAVSFEAGADILLICKNKDNVIKSFEIIRDKLLQGRIPFQRLHQSYKRIQMAKSKFLSRENKISITKIKEYFKL